MPDDDDVVPYKMKAFFEERLKGHGKVKSLTSIDHRRYSIERKIGDRIEMYISGKYLFTEADYFDAKNSYPSVNCIVVGSPYGSYTVSAKNSATGEGKALFLFKELYGALHIKNYRTYSKQEPKKQ